MCVGATRARKGRKQGVEESTMANSSDCNIRCTVARLKRDFLLDTYENCLDSLASKQTIKYRMLAYVLREIELTFGQVSQLVHTHTPVHEEVAEILKPLVKQEHYQTLLAQDFVENEKLVKIVKHLCKNDHTDVVHILLAMDGMSGNKLNHGPNVDVKRYIGNLKFGLSGQVGLYDNEPNDTLKRAHVFAVRQVYKALPAQAQRVNNVFHILKRVLQEYTGEEWTIGGTTSVVHNLDEETLQMGMQTYKANMTDENYQATMQQLKNKITRQRNSAASEDDEEEEEEEVVVATVAAAPKTKGVKRKATTQQS
ncbi:hypothetical protein JTE90_017584 [Oedothorax gibbosus]|uniref:Uncharacterized protein n=1 Tax=Oedothorax gibbosus TaxID=931172 RepID=A0AAV6TLJ4_9ARAC|nr:hypothetical protein JTE90_017584 [Oedothorax gibbosus]